MPPRRLQIAVGAVVLSLVMLFVLSRAPGVAVPDLSDAAPGARRLFTEAPPGPPAPVVPADEAPEVPQPGVAAVAHGEIARALGLVAIRCFVGPELDASDLVGAYHQRIENGWYSHVETTLEGSHGVERRFPRGESPDDPLDVDFETVFFVRWKANGPGETVPCEVSWPKYAELTVRVVDEAGRPLPGARVFGCGKAAEADAGGAASLEVFAEQACDVRGYTRFDVDEPVAMRTGEIAIDPLAEHESRAVVLTLVEPVDGVHAISMEPDPDSLVPWPPTAAHQAAEVAVYQRLRAEADPAAAPMYDRLIAHREQLIEQLRESEQQLAEIEARMAEMRALVEAMQSGESSSDELIEATQRILDAVNVQLEP